MPITHFLQESKKFEVQVYKKPKNLKDLIMTHIPFSGSPQKHPYDKDKIILLTDPYCSNTSYFEFKTGDISFVQELPNIVNMKEETVTMVRVWVKKKSVGVRCTPFIVISTEE